MATKKFSYSEAIREVEKIMYKLENEEIDIDQLSENVKKAGELIGKCKEKLRTTETEVEKIMENIQNN